MTRAAHDDVMVGDWVRLAGADGIVLDLPARTDDDAGPTAVVRVLTVHGDLMTIRTGLRLLVPMPYAVPPRLTLDQLLDEAELYDVEDACLELAALVESWRAERVGRRP